MTLTEHFMTFLRFKGTWKLVSCYTVLLIWGTVVELSTATQKVGSTIPKQIFEDFQNII